MSLTEPQERELKRLEDASEVTEYEAGVLCALRLATYDAIERRRIDDLLQRHGKVR